MKTILMTVIMLVCLGACQYEGKSRAENKSGMAQTIEANMSEDTEMAAPRSDELSPPPPPDPNQLAPPASKIVKNASLTIQVKDIKSTRKDLQELGKRYRVIVSNEEETRMYDRVQVTMSIQVAPERLDSFLIELEELALYVEQRNVSLQDVTQQYVDLESRIKSRKAVIERYQQLLKVAKSVKDILEVEEKLNYAIEELESSEAQMRVLSGQIKYSNVNLAYYELIDQPAVAQRGFFSRLLSSLQDGWQFLQLLTLGIVAVWPVWIILAVIIAWWVKRKKRLKETQ